MDQTQELLSPSLGLWIWTIIQILLAAVAMFFILRFIFKAAKKNRANS